MLKRNSFPLGFSEGFKFLALSEVRSLLSACKGMVPHLPKDRKELKLMWPGGGDTGGESEETVHVL